MTSVYRVPKLKGGLRWASSEMSRLAGGSSAADISRTSATIDETTPGSSSEDVLRIGTATEQDDLSYVIRDHVTACKDRRWIPSTPIVLAGRGEGGQRSRTIDGRWTASLPIRFARQSTRRDFSQTSGIFAPAEDSTKDEIWARKQGRRGSPDSTEKMIFPQRTSQDARWRRSLNSQVVNEEDIASKLPEQHLEEKADARVAAWHTSGTGSETDQGSSVPVHVTDVKTALWSSIAGLRPTQPLRSETASAAVVDDDETPPSDAGLSDGLDYQIPPAALRSALLSSPSSGASYWRHSLYRSGTGEKIAIFLCKKTADAERVARDFANERVLGFDIEWEQNARPNIDSLKDNVSLIQIAGEDKIALFQLAAFPEDGVDDLMPASLKALLENPDIVKAGVNVAGDFTRLRKCLGVQGQGIFELSHLYKVVKHSESRPELVDKRLRNLADQVEELLRLPLYKGAVRTSHWSKKLQGEQVEYAASDAYAGFRLFHALEARRKLMDPMPPRPAFHEQQKPLVLGDGRTAPVRLPKVVVPTVVDESSEEDVFEDCDNKPMSDNESSETKVSTDDTSALSEDSSDYTTATEDIEDSDVEDTRPPVSNKVVGADAWAAKHRAENPVTDGKRRSSPASLRAWHLWHVEGLSLQEVAALVRTPPLRVGSVAAYVLEAATLDGLPYEDNRLVDAFQKCPPAAQPAYRMFLRRALKQ